jgi:hypothetical protein
METISNPPTLIRIGLGGNEKAGRLFPSLQRGQVLLTTTRDVIENQPVGRGRPGCSLRRCPSTRTPRGRAIRGSRRRARRPMLRSLPGGSHLDRTSTPVDWPALVRPAGPKTAALAGGRGRPDRATCIAGGRRDIPTTRHRVCRHRSDTSSTHAHPDNGRSTLGRSGWAGGRGRRPPRLRLLDQSLNAFHARGIDPSSLQPVR